MASKKPVQQTNPQELAQEIATVAKDIIHPLYGGKFTTEDDTLISRGGAKGLKTYDELERDGRVFAVMQKRKMAVISRDWQVDPASEDPLDVKAADEVRRQLSAFNFDKLTFDLLDAVLKGYAVNELMWEIQEERLVVKEGRPRDQDRFTFGSDEAGPQLRLLTKTNPLDGETVPDRKFLVHSFGSKNNNPLGVGLGNKLFWPVFFKKKGITFWLTFADKYGSPTAIGKYPPGTGKPEQKKLLDALQAIAQDAGVIVPEGMVISLLEAAKSGIDTYEKLVRYMDEQISEIVLGETGTINQSGGDGSRAQDEVADDNRLELAQADSDLLAATPYQALATWITEMNVPGANPPTIWRDFQKKENLKARAERDKLLADTKQVRFKKVYFTRNYGFQEDEIEEVTPGESAVSPAFAALTGASMAREENRAAQAILDAAAEDLAGNFESVLGKRVEELLAMLETSGDLVTFKKNLGKLLQKGPPKEMMQAIQNARFAAHVMGRAKK